MVTLSRIPEFVVLERNKKPLSEVAWRAMAVINSLHNFVYSGLAPHVLGAGLHVFTGDRPHMAIIY